MYVVWTSWNSFDLTLSHHTILNNARFPYTTARNATRFGFGACVCGVLEAYRGSEDLMDEGLSSRT